MPKDPPSRITVAAVSCFIGAAAAVIGPVVQISMFTGKMTERVDHLSSQMTAFEATHDDVIRLNQRVMTLERWKGTQ